MEIKGFFFPQEAGRDKISEDFIICFLGEEIVLPSLLLLHLKIHMESILCLEFLDLIIQIYHDIGERQGMVSRILLVGQD